MTALGANEATLAFGTPRGKSLREVVRDAPNYLDWVLEKDFSEEVKGIVRRARSGEFPTPPATGGQSV